MKPTEQNRYYVLDGIRGLAALCVMTFHYVTNPAFTWFINSPVAVDLFFMLSGFVLCHSYYDKIKSGRLTYDGFIVRRLIRLYPMLFLSLVLGFAALVLLRKLGYTDYNVRETFISVIYNALLLPYINQGTMHLYEHAVPAIGSTFPTNGVIWSLFFEILVNLAFFKLAFRSTRQLFFIALFSYGVMMLFGLFRFFIKYHVAIDADTGWSSLNMMGGFPRVLYGFSAGIAIYKLVDLLKKRQPHHEFPAWIKTLSLFSLPAALLLFAFPYYFEGYTFVVSIILFCPVIVFIGAMAETRNVVLKKICVFLGWLSYPVYCLHTPIGNVMAALSNEGGLSNVLGLQWYAIAIPAVIIVAIAVTKFYEEPVRQFLTRLAMNRLKEARPGISHVQAE